MKGRSKKYYRKIFRAYPDMVTLLQFRERKNSQTYKTAITMEALRQFVSNRMENNTLFLSCVGNLENDQLKTILSSDCEKAKTENEVLSAFLKEMQECDNVQLLWNEYWNNIIQQTPPSYYE